MATISFSTVSGSFSCEKEHSDKVGKKVIGNGETVIGGIVGGGDTGNISNSTNYATIYGGYTVGGIAGNTGGTIQNCYSYGSIITTISIVIMIALVELLVLVIVQL